AIGLTPTPRLCVMVLPHIKFPLSVYYPEIYNLKPFSHEKSQVCHQPRDLLYRSSTDCRKTASENCPESGFSN
ncbi:hypothetical protein, partial [Laceyella sediminis]|uniref:hypothetical protein n=1 Tax=Laceyella sediminis TaxID=573074 RepID=UPI001C6250EC